jgi:Ni/Co efflux regulator RcnB
MKHLLLGILALGAASLTPMAAQAAVGVAQKEAVKTEVTQTALSTDTANNRHGYSRHHRGYGHHNGYRHQVYRHNGYRHQGYRQQYRQPHYRNSGWNNNWHNDRRYDWRGHRARYQNYYRPGPYYAPYGYSNRSNFSIGVSIGQPYYQPNYYVNNPGYYRLPDHYGSYRWVRHYNDVMLIDTRNGYVVDMVRDFYY